MPNITRLIYDGISENIRKEVAYKMNFFSDEVYFDDVEKWKDAVFMSWEIKDKLRIEKYKSERLRYLWEFFRYGYSILLVLAILSFILIIPGILYAITRNGFVFFGSFMFSIFMMIFNYFIEDVLALDFCPRTWIFK